MRKALMLAMGIVAANAAELPAQQCPGGVCYPPIISGQFTPAGGGFSPYFAPPQWQPAPSWPGSFAPQYAGGFQGNGFQYAASSSFGSQLALPPQYGQFSLQTPQYFAPTQRPLLIIIENRFDRPRMLPFCSPGRSASFDARFSIR